MIMKFLKTIIWYFFDDFSRAKQAGILVRQGRKQEALDLMSNTKII